MARNRSFRGFARGPAAVVFAFALVGCSGVAVDHAAIDGLGSGRIDANVTFAERAFNNSPGKATGAVFGGALGALVATSSGEPTDVALGRALREGAWLDAVAVDCFESALMTDPTWRARLSARSDAPYATFHLDVRLYGFSTYNFLRDSAEPAFGMQATLVDRHGRELWQYYKGLIDDPPSLPKYTLEEYLAEPDRFRMAAAALCEDLVRNQL